MTARTEGQIFDEFKKEHFDDGFRWGEYWKGEWLAQLYYYFEMDWFLIPCARYSKKPLAGWRWTEKRLEKDEAIWYAAQGCNLAVVSGPSRLIVLDYDSDAVQPFDVDTLVMRTAKGYQYYCRPPYDERLGEKLAKKGFDVPRAGMMYALVPLSKTCRNDRGGRCSCTVHDFRIREWYNPEEDIAPFKEIGRELLEI